MSRVLRDARVWLPALAGLLCWLPRALPTPPTAPAARAVAFPLPTLRGLPPSGAHHYELAADRSLVRFDVQGPRGELLVDCPACRGELHLDATAGSGTIELRLDLSSLAAHDGEQGLDLHHVLGVRRADDVLYRADLVMTTRTDLPGLQRLTFHGLLHFGNRAVQQPMELWLCNLPGQPLRLQGHGTVVGEQFGLPVRSWFGMAEHHSVSLGLDLAWRRTRGN